MLYNYLTFSVQEPLGGGRVTYCSSHVPDSLCMTSSPLPTSSSTDLLKVFFATVKDTRTLVFLFSFQNAPKNIGIWHRLSNTYCSYLSASTDTALPVSGPFPSHLFQDPFSNWKSQGLNLQPSARKAGPLPLSYKSTTPPCTLSHPAHRLPSDFGSAGASVVWLLPGQRGTGMG